MLLKKFVISYQFACADTNMTFKLQN